MICGNNGWLLALDNLSYLTPWLSDALCRLSTGGGFSTRTLYENNEETIFDSTRPTILTGIEEVVTRGDLLDRSIIVSLPAIPEPAPAGVGNLAAIRGGPAAAVGGASTMRWRRRWKTSAARSSPPCREWRTSHSGLRQQSRRSACSPASSCRFTPATAPGPTSWRSTPAQAGKAVLDFLASTSLWTGSVTRLAERVGSRGRRKDAAAEGMAAVGPHAVGSTQKVGPQLAGSRHRSGLRHRRQRPGQAAFDHDCESRGKQRPHRPQRPRQSQSGCLRRRWGRNRGDGDAAGTQGDIDASPYGARAGTHGDGGDDEIPAYSAESIDVPSEAF